MSDLLKLLSLRWEENIPLQEMDFYRILRHKLCEKQTHLNYIFHSPRISIEDICSEWSKMILMSKGLILLNKTIHLWRVLGFYAA